MMLGWISTGSVRGDGLRGEERVRAGKEMQRLQPQQPNKGGRRA